MVHGNGDKKFLYRPRHIEGVCEKVQKGVVRLGFWVGNCNGYGFEQRREGMLSWQRANEKKVFTKYPGMSGVSFFLVGFDHFFFLVKDFEMFTFVWLFQSWKRHPWASLATNCSPDGIFSEILSSCKEDIEVLYIPKMLGFKSKVDMAECFSRMHWTVFTPRWYRTPHSSYIQNNHVYRIIPLKQRKKTSL